jgi:hypothetical protein
LVENETETATSKECAESLGGAFGRLADILKKVEKFI